MFELRSLLDRAIGPFDPSTDRALDLTMKRAGQRQRRRRVGAAVVGLAASLVALGLVVWTFAGRDEGQPAGGEQGRFMFIGGDALKAENRLYIMNADGSDLGTIPTGDLYLMSAAPSPDGELIALMASEPWPKGDMPKAQLFLMDADGSDLEEIPACPQDGTRSRPSSGRTTRRSCGRSWSCPETKRRPKSSHRKRSPARSNDGSASGR